MNLRKHIFGMALFSVIVLSAVFVKAYFTTSPAATARRFTVNIPPERRAVSAPQAVDYKVRLVSLDFINRQSYVALELRRAPGEEAPERLWVTTVFFLPGSPTKIWTSVSKVREPFAEGDRYEYVATAECNWCGDANAPRAGYFARVYVSAGPYGGPDLPGVPFEQDIKTAIPVVVQAERNRKLIP